jgi:hypothetical protein
VALCFFAIKQPFLQGTMRHREESGMLRLAAFTAAFSLCGGITIIVSEACSHFVIIIYLVFNLKMAELSKSLADSAQECGIWQSRTTSISIDKLVCTTELKCSIIMLPARNCHKLGAHPHLQIPTCTKPKYCNNMS